MTSSRPRRAVVRTESGNPDEAHTVRADGSRLLSTSGAKRMNAVLLTCGTYDAISALQ